MALFPGLPGSAGQERLIDGCTASAQQWANADNATLSAYIGTHTCCYTFLATHVAKATLYMLFFVKSYYSAKLNNSFII